MQYKNIKLNNIKFEEPKKGNKFSTCSHLIRIPGPLETTYRITREMFSQGYLNGPTWSLLMNNF